jgi:hypothetical protein
MTTEPRDSGAVSRVGDRRRGVQDAPWLRPPFPASCPFRGFHHSVSGPRHIEPDNETRAPARGGDLRDSDLGECLRAGFPQASPMKDGLLGPRLLLGHMAPLRYGA